MTSHDNQVDTTSTFEPPRLTRFSLVHVSSCCPQSTALCAIEALDLLIRASMATLGPLFRFEVALCLPSSDSTHWSKSCLLWSTTGEVLLSLLPNRCSFCCHCSGYSRLENPCRHWAAGPVTATREIHPAA